MIAYGGTIPPTRPRVYPCCDHCRRGHAADVHAFPCMDPACPGRIAVGSVVPS